MSIYSSAEKTAASCEFRIALASNLAAVCLKLEDYESAAVHAEKGLKLGADGQLNEKLEHRFNTAKERKAANDAADIGDRDALRVEGNTEFSAKNYVAARGAYLRACRQSDMDLTFLKLASNIALVSLKLEMAASAASWCEKGLKGCAAIAGVEAEQLQAKLERRHELSLLLKDILENYQASLVVTPRTPTNLTQLLRRMVFSSKDICVFNGQFAQATQLLDFLSLWVP